MRLLLRLGGPAAAPPPQHLLGFEPVVDGMSVV
jgi:hypothetical protein